MAACVLDQSLGDVSEVDTRLLDLWHFASLCVLRVIFALLFLTVTVNFFGAFFLGFMLMYALLWEHYRCTSRQLHRIEEASKVKLNAHLHDTVNELMSIRAFSIGSIQQSTFSTLLMKAIQATCARRSVESWAGTWFGIVGAVCVLITTLLLAIDPDAVDTGLASCAILYSFIILSQLNFSVRMEPSLFLLFVSETR